MVTTYDGWVADGSPASPAVPIADMKSTFEGHGYTVYWYPDERHQLAQPPEDHTPYSHTPWPGSQPYSYVLALDLMPKDGNGKSLAPIARRIISDKDGGRAPWIKYINWTDENGQVWHTSWQPNKSTSSSSDSGHIHISIRTDYVTSTAARGWDPTGGTMAGDAFTDPCSQDTGHPGRTRDQILADVENLRNFLFTPPDGTTVNPPSPESLIMVLIKAIMDLSTGGISQDMLNTAVKLALSDPNVVAALVRQISLDHGNRLITGAPA